MREVQDKGCIELVTAVNVLVKRKSNHFGDKFIIGMMCTLVKKNFATNQKL